jgi:hypothetical protein
MKISNVKSFQFDNRAKEAATIQESHTQSRTKSLKIANTVKSNTEQSLMARKYSFFKLHPDQNITLSELRGGRKESQHRKRKRDSTEFQNFLNVLIAIVEMGFRSSFIRQKKIKP